MNLTTLYRMKLRTKKQRYNFIAAMHVAILGLFILGTLLVFIGWKYTIALIMFILIVYLVSMGMTKWAEAGEK